MQYFRVPYFFHALYPPIVILLNLSTNKNHYVPKIYHVSFHIIFLIVILSFNDLWLPSLILMFILSCLVFDFKYGVFEL